MAIDGERIALDWPPIIAAGAPMVPDDPSMGEAGGPDASAWTSRGGDVILIAFVAQK